MKFPYFANVSFLSYVVNIFIILNFCEARVKLLKNVTVPAVIVFGDSIVDQGNNNNLNTIAKCNFYPYGKDILGGIATGRFSNGRTPPDILAEELGVKEFVPAYLDPHLQPADLLTGVSFASGGAGLDPLTSQIPSAISMEAQLNLFKEYTGKLEGLVGETRTNFIVENSFYMVLCGSNDLLNTYFLSHVREAHYDINSYTDLLVKKASEFVMKLHNLGAKRLAIFGDPPLGCLPSQRTLAGGLLRECNERYNQAAQMYNSKLIASLKALGYSFNDPKARLVYIDIYNNLLELIQNYKQYGSGYRGLEYLLAKKIFQGLKVVNKGCCGTGEIEASVLCNKYDVVCSDDTSYLFWDSYHPTEQGYRLLVDQIVRTGLLNNFF